MTLFLFLVFISLLFLSAFFSGTETALVSMGKLRIKKIISEKNMGALQEWIDRPKSVLTSILIGNNIVNICFSALFTFFAIEIAIGLNINKTTIEVLSAVFISFVILLFGEIIPKIVARSNNEKIVVITYRSLWRIYRILHPLSLALNKLSDIILGGKRKKRDTQITKEELKDLFSTGEEQGILDKDEEQMMQKVLRLHNVPVNKIMTPVDKIDFVEDIEDGDIVEKIMETGRSRVPVFTKHSKPVGFINVRDILKKWKSVHNGKIKGIIRPLYYIAADRSSLEVLQEFKKKKIHFALVTGQGRVVGLITIEDIIEELTGEIVDEFDVLLGRR